MRRSFYQLNTLLFSVAVVMTMFSGVVSATNNKINNSNNNSDNTVEVEKIVICHSNNSAANTNKPYGPKPIEVAVDGLNGHDEHVGDTGSGVVWNNAIHTSYKTNPKTDWGDIIPPVGDFPGLNWDKYGQAVYENDCNYVEAVTTKPVTFVNPTCDAKGKYTVPETTGVVYYIGDKVVAAGTYVVETNTTITVIAKAVKGYILTDESGTKWSNSFVTPTNCNSTPGTVAGSSTTVTPQVVVTPVGAADAGGAGTATLVGLVGSTLVLSLGAVIRKFSL